MHICPPEAQSYPPIHPLLRVFQPGPNIMFALGGMCTGAIIRIAAQNALGSSFRWELSIQKDHKLVTSGPYFWVRHPAYLGGSLMFIAHAVLLHCSGTFLEECLATHPMIAYARYALTLSRLTPPIYGLWRVREEDRMLRRQFGEDWDRWAAQTRYGLLPYVY